MIMKRMVLFASLVLLMGVSNVANAQNANISVNINKQPSWGPEGYETANFYFFPDLNVYFDVNSSLFYYQSGSNWISNRYLPNKYSKYDLYSLYKIVINDDSQPWSNHKNYKSKYSGYKGNKTQTSIRYSSESKYSSSKSNSVVWVNNDNFEKKDKNSDKSSNKNNSNKNTNNNSQSNRGSQNQQSSTKNKESQSQNSNNQSGNKPQSSRK